MPLSCHFLTDFVPLLSVAQIKLHPGLAKIYKNHKTLVSCSWGISVLPYFTFVNNCILFPSEDWVYLHLVNNKGDSFCRTGELSQNKDSIRNNVIQ